MNSSPISPHDPASKETFESEFRAVAEPLYDSLPGRTKEWTELFQIFATVNDCRHVVHESHQEMQIDNQNLEARLHAALNDIKHLTERCQNAETAVLQMRAIQQVKSENATGHEIQRLEQRLTGLEELVRAGIAEQTSHTQTIINHVDGKNGHMSAKPAQVPPVSSEDSITTSTPFQPYKNIATPTSMRTPHSPLPMTNHASPTLPRLGQIPISSNPARDTPPSRSTSRIPMHRSRLSTSSSENDPISITSGLGAHGLPKPPQPQSSSFLRLETDNDIWVSLKRPLERSNGADALGSVHKRARTGPTVMVTHPQPSSYMK
ncbi:hypothetical protein M408DRAFT_29723 [Serendipita vermifera MAFF 305830]|uniref:Uncharacterized protein n=1 Tax=Serendipita vermifera MAFF 305830 TaxID=933852 RepID=A0A0C3AMG9_SERVB|nr:hypothetical protein M408DRAFT_29723 [Serendipita vermifera MAFF 305830]